MAVKAKSSGRSGGRSKIQKNTNPVVFMFQPKFFKQVDVKDLAEWERMTAEYCGIDFRKMKMEEEDRKNWVRGESISGSGDGWDDSDWTG